MNNLETQRATAGHTISSEYHHGNGADQSAAAVIEVDIRNAHDASEYADLENRFRKLTGVTRVHLDRTRGVAHLSYDPAKTTPEKLEANIGSGGYRCGCKPRPASKSQAGHPCVGAHDHTTIEPVVAGTEEPAGYAQHAAHGERATHAQHASAESPVAPHEHRASTLR